MGKTQRLRFFEPLFEHRTRLSEVVAGQTDADGNPLPRDGEVDASSVSRIRNAAIEVLANDRLGIEEKLALLRKLLETEIELRTTLAAQDSVLDDIESKTAAESFSRRVRGMEVSEADCKRFADAIR